MKKILSLFSYIFHPLFISVYAVLLFFYCGDSYFEYYQIYIVVIQIIIMTIFIPLTFYYLLLSYGKIESVMLVKVAQRKIPLFIHAALMLILIQKSIRIDNLIELHYFFLGSLISTISALLFVFFNIKASLHMMAMTALNVFTIAISWHFQVRFIFVIILLLITSGLVATSRLTMKAHTLKELLWGGILGVLPQILLLKFWL